MPLEINTEQQILLLIKLENMKLSLPQLMVAKKRLWKYSIILNKEDVEWLCITQEKVFKNLLILVSLMPLLNKFLYIYQQKIQS